jgi:hypothetical protein
MACPLRSSYANFRYFSIAHPEEKENEKNENCRFSLPPHFGAVCTIEGRFETLKMDTYLLKIG